MLETKIYCNEMQNDVERFYRKCFAENGWEFEPNGQHSDITNVQDNYMINGCMWCLCSSSQLIGAVAIRTIDESRKTAEMKRLYVLNEHQGNGYGGMLFQVALGYARENGFSRICADTRHDRDASQHLMRKYGFSEVQRYNDNQFAELFFELKL